jgi:hypothetical protein
MTGQPPGDFLAALGQEFCETLSPPIPEDLIVPQDANEVWLRAFGQPPSPELLTSLSGPQLSRLRDECERYFECPAVSVQHVRSAVARTGATATAVAVAGASWGSSPRR